MPVCLQSGCPVIVDKGRCAEHGHAHDMRRGSAQQRGFTSQWARFSRAWRLKYPVCGMRADGLVYPEHSICAKAGLVGPAECVDHIDGHHRHDDRQTFYRTDRLQSLCLRCNTRKAIENEGGFGR